MLCAAALRAISGKRRVPGPAAFFANLEIELLRLERELRAGTWRPGGYVSSEIRDPKRRLISAAPFRDRVVHHAVHAVIAPLFERGFIEHTYANGVGKGTHRAVARYERLRDRNRYVLCGDVYRYFPAIDHEVLKADLRRRIACRPTLSVLDRIIDASNPQEPVHLYYPGDDLFTPYERRRGLPIGNLTSQLFANVYLDRFRPLRHRGAARALICVTWTTSRCSTTTRRGWPPGANARRHSWRGVVCRCTRRRRTWRPRRCRRHFLGFELRPGGRRRLPEDGVRRFRNRLRGLRDRWRAGTVTRGEVEQRVRAWVAHAAHADTWRLRRAIFPDGWFAPGGRPVPGA